MAEPGAARPHLGAGPIVLAAAAAGAGRWSHFLEGVDWRDWWAHAPQPGPDVGHVPECPECPPCKSELSFDEDFLARIPWDWVDRLIFLLAGLGLGKVRLGCVCGRRASRRSAPLHDHFDNEDYLQAGIGPGGRTGVSTPSTPPSASGAVWRPRRSPARTLPALE